MKEILDALMSYIDGVSIIQPQSFESKHADKPKSLQSTLIFTLMGQSNMSGRGVPETEDLTPHSRVKKWKDHSLDNAVESIHGFDGRGEGVGPGLSFGKTLANHLENSLIVLVPTAVGSTSIAKWGPGKDLYNNALHQTREALKHIPESTFAGVLWAQGESDSSSSKTAKKYGKKLQQLVDSFFTDIGAVVPWIAAELSDGLDHCTAMKAKHWRVVNEGMQNCKNITTVATSGFSTVDTLHYDSKSQRELGKRFAEAWLQQKKSE